MGVHGYTVTEEKRSCVVNHVMIISIFSCPSTLRITNSTMSPGALEYCMSNCRSLMKVKFPTDQFRLALGSCHCLMDCHHAQKTSKLPYFRLFRPDTQILSGFSALYWPSTAFYWPSTTKYQPLRSHTDPVPSCINWECCFGIRDFCTVYPGSSFWRNNRSSP